MFFTYELSKAVGESGAVIAFEPDPLNFELLTRNVARYGLSNVTLVRAAISDKSGLAQFNSEGANGSALSAALNRPAASGKISVKAISLADACADYGVPVFAKIDAEGAEIEILSGAVEFLRKNPIQFAADTSHFRGGDVTAARVESIFRSAGYLATSAEVGGYLTTWAFPA